MKRLFAFLFILAAACGPSYGPQPYYYDQQPVQPIVAPVIVPSVPIGGPVLIPQTVVRTKRVTTVAPVQVQQQQPRATLQTSNYQQQAAPTSNNLSDRNGMVKSFQVQQGQQQSATGFGARAVIQAPSRPSPSARPATQFRAPKRN